MEMGKTIRTNGRGVRAGRVGAAPASLAAPAAPARPGLRGGWRALLLFAAAVAATLALGVLAMAQDAEAATQVLALQSFDPEGGAKNILRGFAFFIALAAIFGAVGRFMRGATMGGVGMLAGGAVLFALAIAPESLLSFGQWTLQQLGLG